MEHVNVQPKSSCNPHATNNCVFVYIIYSQNHHGLGNGDPCLLLASVKAICFVDAMFDELYQITLCHKFTCNYTQIHINVCKFYNYQYTYI